MTPTEATPPYRRSVRQILASLRSLDIRIWSEQNRLRVNAPKGAMTDPFITELSERKEEILSYLNAETLLANPIPHNVSSHPIPASFAQQRLWFLEKLEGPSATYNIPLVIHLEGNLDFDALQFALSALIQRHPALRTGFTDKEGTPVQVILPHIDLKINIIDLVNIHSKDHKRFLVEEAQRPFKLDQPPLARFTFFRYQENRFTLLVSMHHIISDGWSSEIFYDELTTLYATYTKWPALTSVHNDVLAEIPIQYADFSNWQLEIMNSAWLEEELDYWQSKFVGAPQLIDLPLDRSRPPVQSNRGATHVVQLTTQVANGSRKMASENHTTLFMVFCAAYQVLLHRYSRQDDIVIGIPVVGRDRPELKNIIGFFVNTVVLRANLSDDPSFLELLSKLRQEMFDVFAHQQTPFEKVVETVQPERDPSRSPIFQVMFSFESNPLQPMKIGNLQFKPLHPELELDLGISKFDLSLSILEAEDSIYAIFEYRTDLFEPATITRMAEHFQILLEGMIARPESPISELPLISVAERAQLIEEWSHSPEILSYRPTTIVGWFEEQAANSPESIAVIHEGKQLTYQELNQRANCLAHQLRILGADRNTFVGIALERSIELIIALFGVLKSGAAYLPLDPVYPAERLNWMIEDARPVVLITHRSSTINFERTWSQEALAWRMEFVYIDEFIRQWGGAEHLPALPCNAEKPVDNPTKINQPDDLAYLIYTSGSTGKPKGVMIPHRAMAHYVAAIRQKAQLTASDREMLFSSISFDASVEEIYPILVSGGSLVLRTDEMLASPSLFLEACAAYGITAIGLPTSYWHILASEIAAGRAYWPTKLRIAHIGGERMLPDSLLDWSAAGQKQTIILNAYGPTEATIVACWSEMTGENASPYALQAPIGRPIPGKQAYIVDKRLQPVPIGVPGELLLGGEGIALGYLNQPELTDQKFIPNPFFSASTIESTPPPRLYRTGDLARFLPNGEIEYLGRIDRQVKLRGYRIELGEIESVLSQHPQVESAVVLLNNHLPGDPRLVAYLTAAPGQPKPSTDDLRRALKTRLPDYMVPWAFITLDAFPITPNGKIDYQALPHPDYSFIDTSYVSPRNAQEEILAELWACLLKLERVGIYDNFFQLGGHSLLVTQMLFRINETFCVELPLRSLFNHPTIAELAVLIKTARQPAYPTISTGLPVLNLEHEAQLDLSIVPPADESSLPKLANARKILLTGATGFVGAFLLVELLKQTDATILCLVRAENELLAQQRLKSHWQTLLLNSDPQIDDAFNSRAIAINGDLALPKFGLTHDGYAQLESQLDAIFHVGAWVNFIQPYSALKPANVWGTQEILRLASHRRLIPVHHISTLSVLHPAAYPKSSPVLEDTPLLGGNLIEGGYPQSKWVAEKLVEQARSRGIPVNVYRFGAISGASQTGIWDPDAYLYRLIKGCIQLGSYPEITQNWRLTPVDSLAKIILQVAKSDYPENGSGYFGKTFHIEPRHEISWQKIMDAVNANSKILRPLSFNAWLNELIKVSEQSPQHALFPLIPLILAQHSIMEEGELVLDTKNFHTSIAGSDLDFPVIDDDLLRKYVRHIVQST
jgi:amino acid adenylation domain-containing protein/thioester reductase-like protein